MHKDALLTLLNDEARRINTPAFIVDDPVQFPRRFASLPDIEIAALLSSHIAWGNRRMICRDCERMLDVMEGQPYAYVRSRAYEDFPDEQNVHRTFFGRNFKYFLRGLSAIYSRHASLADFARSCGVGQHEFPSWHLAQSLNACLAEANGGRSDNRCLPSNLDATALKRLNMALRWLVRNDGIVDLGVWDVISPSQLFIPLDVHVGNTCRNLAITSRRANDRKTVLEITSFLRRLNPADPVLYDFALFGIGMQL